VPASELSPETDLSLDAPAPLLDQPTEALVTDAVTSPTAAAAPIEPTPITTSTTITAAADGYIDSANPASAAGGSNTTLYVNTSPTLTSFLKFDLTPLAGKTISTVTLRFKTTIDSSAGSVNSSNVKLVGDVLWKEQYLSYSNTVAISETLLGAVPADTAPNTWYEITLEPSSIQQRFGGMLSLAIESTGADDMLLYSREAMDQPQLIITYQ
jgi:hypothetical protein